MKLHTLDGAKPHPSWRGWARFLKTCEVRERYRNVVYYGYVNCNYIVFPDGLIIRNYAYHGHALMDRIRHSGVVKIRKELESDYANLRKLLDRLKTT